MLWKEAVDDMVYCKEFTASSAAKMSPPYALYSTSSKCRYDLHQAQKADASLPLNYLMKPGKVLHSVPLVQVSG